MGLFSASKLSARTGEAKGSDNQVKLTLKNIFSPPRKTYETPEYTHYKTTWSSHRPENFPRFVCTVSRKTEISRGLSSDPAMGRQSLRSPFPIAVRTSSVNAETTMYDERNLPRKASQGTMRMASERNRMVLNFPAYPPCS